MNSSPLLCSDLVKSVVTDHGACRVAIASVEAVSAQAQALYDNWIASGRHASMSYLENYPDIRRDPSLLLPGAKSIICCAFPYHPAPPGMRSRIAAYALGTDYHIVLRQQLEAAAEQIRSIYGGETRVCVDTAPLRERYWAQQSGLGFIGLSNYLIVPGIGGMVFLGEILSTIPFTSDKPLNTDCGNCRRCIKSCPVGALSPDGSVDARKCLSYLTIEHRGDFPPGTNLHGAIYGCDICASVCPHNAHASAATVLPPLRPRPELIALTTDQCRTMTQPQFSTLFHHSAVKRTKLAGLLRNSRHIIKNNSEIALVQKYNFCDKKN